jgi:putative membrane protein
MPRDRLRSCAAMSETTGVDATRRTRLANERTFLAWWRTALGTEGLAVAVGKVVPEVTDGPHWPYVVLGLALALLGTMLAVTGWWRHSTVEHALVGGEEAVPPAWLIAVLAGFLTCIGLMLAVIIIVT